MRSIIAGAVLMATIAAHANQYTVYVGTYTRGASEGIYALDYDSQTGQLSNLRLAAETENPSFLALDPKREVVYAVGEQSDGGTLSAFNINDDRTLTFRDEVNTPTSGPCHVDVHPAAQSLAVANYGGGEFYRYRLGDDRIMEQMGKMFHRDVGPNKPRQDKPHAHGVHHSKDGSFLMTVDLGADRVEIYPFESKTGAMSLNIVPEDRHIVAIQPGAGPRHGAFHPTLPYAYVINELDSTISVLKIPEEGDVETLQNISTMPNTFTQQNTTAEIFVHPNGQFVYGSNRGHDSIAAFRIDQSTGMITLIGHTKTGGKQPRMFNIDPEGNFLLAANQATDNIVVFKIEDDGTLSPTGQQVEIPTPVCIIFKL